MNESESVILLREWSRTNIMSGKPIKARIAIDQRSITFSEELK